MLSGGTFRRRTVLVPVDYLQIAPVRLSRAESAPNPILLLDEVAAHLDAVRRAGLFDEIEALGLQAFLTGVDEELFEHLKGRALGVRVDAGQLAIMEDR